MDLSRYKGKRVQKKTLMSIRDEVAGQIEDMLPGLMAMRDEARNQQGWLRSLLTSELLSTGND